MLTVGGAKRNWRAALAMERLPVPVAGNPGCYAGEGVVTLAVLLDKGDGRSSVAVIQFNGLWFQLARKIT